jgi:hypothetical protein
MRCPNTKRAGEEAPEKVPATTCDANVSPETGRHELRYRLHDRHGVTRFSTLIRRSIKATIAVQ